jgi:RNA polymerase sigma-70 factor (ECF subfamily)
VTDVDDQERMATAFEEQRERLSSLALRMLGSRAEAEDVVQEAWLRFSRTGDAGIDNVGAWLTTVTSRLCLNVLQSRRSRPTAELDSEVPVVGTDVDPQEESVLADTVGLAMLVVLDTLSPAERIAFVLHDLFALPFDEIAPIVGRTPDATRQLASRARRRVRGQELPEQPDRLRQARLVEGFLAAARAGDLTALLEVLDPGIVLRADAAAAAMGAADQLVGIEEVATFSGRARGATPALLDGVPGAVWQQAGVLRVAFVCTFDDERIVAIDLVGDPDRLADLDVVVADSHHTH